MSLDISLCEVKKTIIYNANITHNLVEMAIEAWIYLELWYPDDIGLEKAKELIKPLEEGIETLESDPEYYKQFNPTNGCGSYESLLKFTKEYLQACKDHPEATIEISR